MLRSAQTFAVLLLVWGAWYFLATWLVNPTIEISGGKAAFNPPGNSKPQDDPQVSVPSAARLTLALVEEQLQSSGPPVPSPIPHVSSKDPRTLALNVTAEDLPPDALGISSQTSRFGEGGKTLVFLRIQKTAGTTLERIMERQCALNGWNCDWNWHVDWNYVLQKHAGKRIVCFLRHPVDRVYSEYLFLSQKAHTPPPQGMPQWDYTPEQAASLPLGSIEDYALFPDNPVHERGARYLLGFRRPYIFMCFENCELWWKDYLEGRDVRRMKDPKERAKLPPNGSAPGAAMRLAGEAGWTDAELLEILRGRLARVEFGIAECFEASARLLAKRYGWDERSMLQVAKGHYRAGGKNSVSNRTRRHRDELPSHVVRLLEEKNRLDVKLFYLALEVFRERLRTAGLKVEAEHCNPNSES